MHACRQALQLAWLQESVLIEMPASSCAAAVRIRVVSTCTEIITNLGPTACPVQSPISALPSIYLSDRPCCSRKAMHRPGARFAWHTDARRAMHQKQPYSPGLLLLCPLPQLVVTPVCLLASWAAKEMTPTHPVWLWAITVQDAKFYCL